MNTTIKNNVQYLEASLSYAKADVKPLIRNIIQLYKDRKIANITTAEKHVTATEDNRPMDKEKNAQAIRKN